MNNIENTFIEVYNILKNYTFLGTKETKYANLIGSAPHIGKYAWLHAIYKPITQKQIFEINTELGMDTPKVYQEFLKICNGFSIFSDTLSFDGYRFNYIRDLENVWQPYSLITLNKEKPIDSKPHYFYLGGYNWDGSKLYIDTKDNYVYRCSSNSSRPINKWNSFEEMLLSEVNRLSILFDSNGIKIDENEPTIPCIS